MLLKQVRSLQKGVEPTQPHSPEAYYLRSAAVNATRSTSWQDVMQAYMRLPVAESIVHQ
jgi:hypothetical protein